MQQSTENIGTIKEEHFFDIDEDLLCYLEEHSKQIINKLQTSNETNRKNALTLFQFLSAGSGAAFLVVANVDSLYYLHFSMILACIGWAACAIYLTFTCLMTRATVGFYQEPIMLYSPEMKAFLKDNRDNLTKSRLTKLTYLRKSELYRQITIIEMLKATNRHLSKHLDRAKIAALFILPLSMLLPLFIR